MKYKVFKTGTALDSLLGGGILNDGMLLIVYDTGSYGWALGVEVFRRFVEASWFGVVINYSLPYSILKKYSFAVRFPMEELGTAGKLAVMDVFGSVNGVRIEKPFVYSLGHVDAGTFLPKILALYSTLLKNLPRRIGLTVTLDGFVEIFGEESAMRILKRNMALREGSSRPPGDAVLNVLLLNRDRVSKRFLSWISQFSEHIVELTPTEKPGIERLRVIKSLLPEFEPSTGIFRFKRGKVEVVPTGRD